MKTITDAKLRLKTKTCPLCQGWGELEGYAGVDKMTCFKCKGTGREKIYQLTAQQGAHIMDNKHHEAQNAWQEAFITNASHLTWEGAPFHYFIH
jgi:DnaJ-class molecular chaperone